MAGHNDEKALDTTVASLSNKVYEVKTLLQQLLGKLEQDPTLVWLVWLNLQECIVSGAKPFIHRVCINWRL